MNKNGVRVLKTTKKDCFCHPEIPGFVIGKKQPFTIQLGLLLTNDTDAVLYAQVDGFSIEIINRCLKFSMKGFCELETPEEYKLSSQRAYDIAIRHHNNILTMFLDGKPVAEKKSEPEGCHRQRPLCDRETVYGRIYICQSVVKGVVG
ncbi:hypothetical protein ACIXFL_11035 [Bacteroides fragilis]